ncbi:putative disease resistance RPP13-like protein 3 [Salvia hispanica]|uniref:putative disease resistance RPP13-like protein 3 n=1 Tax=Salvia hispanica TaxID=49212 RepID=UPI0020095296|nr:putative disease resistance RPP13-like protein 3 [Salvia hispanica]
MAEAAVLGMIRDLESMDVTRADTFASVIKLRNIELLKEILDFLRDLKREERLKYFIAGLVDLAKDATGVEIFDYRYCPPFKSIKDEIEMTKMRMTNFGADEKNVGDEEEAEEKEEVVVGLEKDVKKLLDRAIFKKSNKLEIYSIKGMTGIGKTTLARQLYKAGAGQFQRRAWVSISSGTSNKEILMKLIQQMVEGYEGDPSLEEMDNRSLQRILRQNLQGLSYFVVLDKIPEEMCVRSIFNVFPSQGLTGSRLLLTSRYDITTTKVEYTHEMKALNSDKSWQLFSKTINKYTSNENKFSKELEKKGKEMLKKCGGLPMAIIDVARQKAKQRLSGIDWEELFDSIDLCESLKLLEPMYHQLEERIKPHFLYLSIFKENAIIREEKLEQIWAANGLDFEQVTEDFANRSILEVVKLHFERRKCRLNPLLLMISIKKAEEEMGFEILRINGNNGPSQNVRHRVIHCGRDKLNHLTNEDSKQLISLIFHGGGGYLDDTSSS